MLRGIDHIVVSVLSLDEAINNYQQLGFTVVPGGRHPIGSQNALIAFADGSYVELIAFDPGVTHPWADQLRKGGGLADWCLQTDSLDAAIDAFRAVGASLTPPSPLRRIRPDRYELSWVLSLPTAHRGAVPFLIRDVTPRSERVPHQASHENRATGIETLTIAVDDLDFV